jgi:hypothetical protein
MQISTPIINSEEKIVREVAVKVKCRHDLAYDTNVP